MCPKLARFAELPSQNVFMLLGVQNYNKIIGPILDRFAELPSLPSPFMNIFMLLNRNSFS